MAALDHMDAETGASAGAAVFQSGHWSAQAASPVLARLDPQESIVLVDCSAAWFPALATSLLNPGGKPSASGTGFQPGGKTVFIPTGKLPWKEGKPVRFCWGRPPARSYSRNPLTAPAPA